MGAGAVIFLAIVGVTIVCGCAAPLTVDYHADQTSVLCSSPASGRCDLYTAGGSLVASKTILAEEPIGFRKVGDNVLALAGPYEIPVADGNYSWVIIQAQSPVRIPPGPGTLSSFHMTAGIRSRVR
jgi:hypothetical protein